MIAQIIGLFVIVILLLMCYLCTLKVRKIIIFGMYIVAILGFIAYCEYDIKNTDKVRSEVVVDFQKAEVADKSTEIIDDTEMIDAKEQAELEEYDTVLKVVDTSGNSKEVPAHIIVGNNNEIVNVTLENAELDSLESEEEFESYEAIALLFTIMLVIIFVCVVCVTTMR